VVDTRSVIDSKLKASDSVRFKVEDICFGTVVRDQWIVTQLETSRPLQFEITEVTGQHRAR
jgi:hypothetical protein